MNERNFNQRQSIDILKNYMMDDYESYHPCLKEEKLQQLL